MIRAGYANHAYELAGNGEEAIALFESFPPDLILADWNMPKMNGLALLEYVKANHPQIKLGFVTSEQTEEIRAFLVYQANALRQWQENRGDNEADADNRG